jgi:ribosome-associated protein
MKEFSLDGNEFIELTKLLKILKLAGSGGEANTLIADGRVKVNGNVETRKRNKLKAGDVVSFEAISVLIK